jgi:outer membrane protein TolC
MRNPVAVSVTRMRQSRILGLLVTAALLAPGPAAGQAPPVPGPVVERVTFDQAVQRAIAGNPTVAQAAAGILRAEAILRQTRSFSLPSLAAAVSTNTISPVAEFEGTQIIPRTQVTSGLFLSVPLIAAVEWAQRNQAEDQVRVAEQNVVEVKRQIALAAAEAYLNVLALKRVVDLNVVARDTASAQSEYSRQRLEGGLGSRLNYVRAEQVVSADEARVEAAAFAVQRAQEALGVLLAAAGPVDAADEPMLDVPPEGDDDTAVSMRADVQLAALRQSAAERVVRDSWRERLPSVNGFFEPQLVTPSGLFAERASVSAGVRLAVPIFDSGDRTGRKRQREAELTIVRLERELVERQARAEVRTARAAIASADRAVVSARRAATQAAEVLSITDIAFRAGANTNLEVIDAQRFARDADTAVVIAEDAARRARLELLVATGRFPEP